MLVKGATGVNHVNIQRLVALKDMQDILIQDIYHFKLMSEMTKKYYQKLQKQNTLFYLWWH